MSYDQNNPTAHRKVYAKGYFDACKAHGISTEGGIVQQAKFDSLHRGLTGIAKKVFDATPMGESWDLSQIVGEMQRQGVRGDVRTVSGCLHSMVDTGIVAEPKKGGFVRVDVRPKVAHEPIKLTQQMKTIDDTKSQSKPESAVTASVAAKDARASDPIDRLSSISGRVQKAISDLSAIANDIESAALDLAESTEKTNVDAAKMRQLQALLKGLS